MLVFYENCSRTGIQFKDISPAGLSGNGTGYGGLVKTFYRYMAGYKCETQSKALASLEYNSEQNNWTLRQSSTDSCLNANGVVNDTAITHGSLQKDVIGYGPNIFEQKQGDSEITPDKIVEIWCVDDWASPKIEIVSSYQSSSKTATTEIYQSSGTFYTTMNPARSVSAQNVILSANDFSLVVQKSPLAVVPGTYIGTYAPAAPAKSQTLQCRLGGYLDAQLWPAKSLYTDPVTQFLKNPADQTFFVNVKMSNSQTVAHLDSQITSKVDLVSNLQIYSTVSMYLGPTPSEIIFTGERPGDFVPLVYLYNMQAPLATALTAINNGPWNTASSYNQAFILINNAISTSLNGRFIFYMDSSQEQNSGDQEQWLYYWDKSDSSRHQVNQNLPLDGDISVGQFDYFDNQNKVVYSTGNILQDIWIYDMNSGARKKIDFGSYQVDSYAKQGRKWDKLNDQYLALLMCDGFCSDNFLFAIYDVSKDSIVFRQVLNLGTLGFTSYFVDHGFPFLELAGTIAPFYFNASTLTFAEKSDITPKIPSTCLNASMKFAASAKESDSSLIVLVQEQRSDKIVVMRAALTGSQQCTLINIIPASQTSFNANSVIQVKTSPTGTDLLLKISSPISVYPFNKVELLWIPEFFKPSILIATMSGQFQDIWDMNYISKDRVYFYGPVIDDFITSLMTFDLPH